MYLKVPKYTANTVYISFDAGAQYPGHTHTDAVNVSLDGYDSESCGTVNHPCKSIARAVHQVDWGGHIYLNGIGTERKPYDCHLSTAHVQQPGIVVQKSLKMEGLGSTPHVLCFNGFHFIKKQTPQLLNITLSGIHFRKTPLMFHDCEILTISNCSFQDTSIALSILLSSSGSMHLNILRSSFFKNNTSCLEITLKSDTLVKDQFLAININETNFSENGFSKQRFSRGVVTIQSENTLPSRSSSIQVQISCSYVTSVKNYGYFINLDLPSAETSEIYNDIRLFNNTIYDMARASAGRKARHVVNSLYNSNTKKTRVKFSNLRCSHNNLSRCIKIQSEIAQVEIQNSSFVGQRLLNERGGALFFNSTVHGSVVIFNSRFRRNIAKGGGALFAHSKMGTLMLNITNVNFTECAATRIESGWAILVGDQKPRQAPTGTHKLIANFQEISVRDCFGLHGVCDGVRLMLFNGKVTINDSFWKYMDAALNVINTGGKTDVTISGCPFDCNIGETGVVSVVSLNPQGSTLTIVDSVVSRQGKGGNESSAIFVSPQFHISLKNIVVASHFYGLLIGGPPPNAPSESYPLNVSIYNCTFLDNFYDMVAILLDPSQVELTIKNTIFNLTNRKAGPDPVGLFILIEPLKVLNLSKAFIELDNVTFDSKACNIVGLVFRGNKTLRIKRSSFVNGFCFNRFHWSDSWYSVYEVSSGAISVISSSDKQRSPGCVKQGTEEDVHPLWHYQTRVIFEDTLFEGNGGLIAGAVYICNGHTTFERCTFRNNFAAENSGHVSSAYGTGQVDFKDCTFSSTKENTTNNGFTFQKSTFLHSESGGPINLQNTTMISFAAERTPYPVLNIFNGGYVHMDDNSTIQCPIGSQLLVDNMTHFIYTEQNYSFCRINITALKYSCQLCSPGLYSLRKGASRGLIVNGTIECQQCPFGASCIKRNIAAKPNFWGYRTSSDPSSLRFIPCPEHYCQTPTSESQGYNSCHGNRTGILCGKCTQGYSETLFSSECRKNEECNNHWFWILTILLTTGLALYLLMKPPILGFLANQILWFRRKEDNHVLEDLRGTHQHSGADSGYIKITFFFYQAAELLMVGSWKARLKRYRLFVQ